MVVQWCSGNTSRL